MRHPPGRSLQAVPLRVFPQQRQDAPVQTRDLFGRGLRPGKFHFGDRVPTTENLCMDIFRRLRAGFAAAPVARVRLEETSLNSFEYRGEEGRTP